MAITSNIYNIQEMPSDAKAWHVSLASEDVSGCESIKAAETGLYHYLTKLLIRTDAAMDVTIGSGHDGDDVDDIHIGPVPLDAASGIFVWKAPDKKGLKCTVSLAATIDSTAAGTIWIEAYGYTSKH